MKISISHAIPTLENLSQLALSGGLRPDLIRSLSVGAIFGLSSAIARRLKAAPSEERASNAGRAARMLIETRPDAFMWKVADDDELRFYPHHAAAEVWIVASALPIDMVVRFHQEFAQAFMEIMAMKPDGATVGFIRGEG